MHHHLFYIIVGLFFTLGACKHLDVQNSSAEETYIIASRRGYTLGGNGEVLKYFFIRRENEAMWRSDVDLSFSSYKDGYEYRVSGLLETNAQMGLLSDGPSPYRLSIRKIISQEEKNSENLPSDLSYWNPGWAEDYNPFAP